MAGNLIKLSILKWKSIMLQSKQYLLCHWNQFKLINQVDNQFCMAWPRLYTWKWNSSPDFSFLLWELPLASIGIQTNQQKWYTRSTHWYSNYFENVKHTVIISVQVYQWTRYWEFHSYLDSIAWYYLPCVTSENGSIQRREAISLLMLRIFEKNKLSTLFKHC